MTPLITIKNLCVRLGDTDVLRGLNAELQRGKITAVIGYNGSGKTTLLRALLNEVPYSGTIRFHCGHDHSHPLPDQVGYVPQKLRFDAHMPLTVLDLLALARQKKPLFLGVSRKVKAELAAMLAGVGSPPELLDRPFERISGGEQQRVLLALAIEPCPELLLLDEPAAGVDFKDQEKFYDLIARLNSEKRVTILLVSHDISMVSRHAHQVLCMKDGKIECHGTPEEIVTGEALSRTFGSDMGIFHHDHDKASEAVARSPSLGYDQTVVAEEGIPMMPTNQELNQTHPHESNGNPEIARLSSQLQQAQTECDKLRTALARCEMERDEYLKAIYASERAKIDFVDVDFVELEKAAVGPVETIE